MAQRVRDTDPAARVERDARRHVAAGLGDRGGAWVDLRAEDGPAAGDPPHEGATPLTSAFADDDDLAAVREAAGRGGLVTVFDTLEHLPSFAALVQLLVELAEEQEATVVVGVPNDAVGPLDPAARRTTWDEGAFAELRSMLPADHAVWHQLALRGTAVVPAGHEGLHEGAIALTDDDAPVAFLAAFGPLAGELAPAVALVQAEVAAERAARRAADAELAVLRARVAALGGS
jgi:hypothetical protein